MQNFRQTKTEEVTKLSAGPSDGRGRLYFIDVSHLENYFQQGLIKMLRREDTAANLRQDFALPITSIVFRDLSWHNIVHVN